MTDNMKSIVLIGIGAVTVVVSYAVLIYAAVAVFSLLNGSSQEGR